MKAMDDAGDMKELEEIAAAERMVGNSAMMVTTAMVVAAAAVAAAATGSVVAATAMVVAATAMAVAAAMVAAAMVAAANCKRRMHGICSICSSPSWSGTRRSTPRSQYPVARMARMRRAAHPTRWPTTLASLQGGHDEGLALLRLLPVHVTVMHATARKGGIQCNL